MADDFSAESGTAAHKRRLRYRGKHPRRFEEKYKERDPERYGETVAKVLAAGRTPAGMHRPIMVDAVLEVLEAQAGDFAVDCTLGHGGHAEELLKLLQPGGYLLGLDADPVELPKTEARLQALGFGAESFTTQRSNFAGLPQALARVGRSGADVILADLGLSSMQLDDPARGFSFKMEGPLDMRMNPTRGQSASALVQNIQAAAMAELLAENSDEAHASELGVFLAGKHFATTTALAAAVRTALARVKEEECELSVRRVFQALRIAVNDEFAALDAFLRVLPGCLNPGGRVAILIFHSGEDRRVKKAFQAGLRDGQYGAIAENVIRPTPAERHANPRSTSAKLRWARRSAP